MMVPPGARGKVTYLAPAGEYSLEDKVLELEFGDTKKVSFTTEDFLTFTANRPYCRWLVGGQA